MRWLIFSVLLLTGCTTVPVSEPIETNNYLPKKEVTQIELKPVILRSHPDGILMDKSSFGNYLSNLNEITGLVKEQRAIIKYYESWIYKERGKENERGNGVQSGNGGPVQER